MSDGLAITRRAGWTTIPDESAFGSIGFRFSRRDLIVLRRPVGPLSWDILLIIEVNVVTGAWGYVVLDENTGEPYDYELAIPAICSRFTGEVDEAFAELREYGFIGVGLV
ncbi:hypothetical protein [Bifidobacterium sp. SO1]|uniref:hypothetical protein n=1 Tax=Bifidobacterium sp. SO1 TaxID=2809029 RepID=UPI001BDBFF80|nr:hypothetical protein [Bifidobacterium sp. SO1]MBT1162166.1 hypothetical protein [Bifidobacterium sp. SO1]